METLPTEMIQSINDQLDFFDQLNFKNIGKYYYKNIKIKQVLPYLMISGKESYESQHPTYFIRIDKFHLVFPKLLPPKLLPGEESDSDAEYRSDNLIHIIYVLLPDKPITNYMGLGNFFLEYKDDNCNIVTKFNNGEKFNHRIFIQKCLKITNKKLLKDNIV